MRDKCRDSYGNPDRHSNVFSCQQQLEGMTDGMHRDHDLINITETECYKAK